MIGTYTLENVGGLLDKLQAGWREAAIRGLQSLALEIVRDIQSSVIPESGLGTGRGLYRAGWKAEPLPDGAVVYNSVPYASVIEYGRRPGRAIGEIMVANLYDWLKQRDPKRATWSHAWALAMYIKAKGLHQPNGKRILERASMDWKRKAIEHIRAEFAK